MKMCKVTLVPHMEQTLKYLFCSAILASHSLEINIYYAFILLLRKRAFPIETFHKNDCLYLKFMVIFTILAYIWPTSFASYAIM